MIDPYFGREQTKAKHFILKNYLEELAYKVLTFSDVTYVDGFSGPWETKAEGYADSSFMIALTVLKEAQRRVSELGRQPRKVRCFFSEKNAQAFEQLRAAVSGFHAPAEGFEVKVYQGSFEDAVDDIRAFIGTSFPLIFIDPTGWKGYAFDKIRPLFEYPKCEVIINFMYDFINRAAWMDDQEIIASLDPILGGPGWQWRLDPKFARGLAVEKLFRETLRAAGGFRFVVSTKIDRTTADRPHFFLAYGTKATPGLKAFREIEYKALRLHTGSRAMAKERQREVQTGARNLFAGHHASIEESSIDQIVQEHMALAASDLERSLAAFGALRFSLVVEQLLQPYMLRETNVKDICVDLARAGKVENTWGGGNRKPRDGVIIRLTSSAS